MTKTRKIFLAILIGLVILVGGSGVYVADYYHADKESVAALGSSEKVTVSKIEEGYYFDGEGSDCAMIFYPGAKVEYTAYAPLMKKIAEQGMDCFLVKMPCNLAFLGKNKADDIMEEYSYKEWYLSGHSLGGAMAAVYAAEQRNNLTGLVLLAAYPTATLPESSFQLLTIYGSNDGVLTMKKVEEGKTYWPKDSKEYCIEGGNHAWFGNYGIQKGDGEAVITHDEQQNQTAELIEELRKESGK